MARVWICRGGLEAVPTLQIVSSDNKKTVIARVRSHEELLGPEAVVFSVGSILLNKHSVAFQGYLSGLLLGLLDSEIR